MFNAFKLSQPMTFLYLATARQLGRFCGIAAKRPNVKVGSKVTMLWASRDMTKTKLYPARVVALRSRQHKVVRGAVVRHKAVAVRYTTGEIEEVGVDDMARHARASQALSGETLARMCPKCGRGFAGKNAGQAYGGHQSNKRCRVR